MTSDTLLTNCIKTKKPHKEQKDTRIYQEIKHPVQHVVAVRNTMPQTCSDMHVDSPLNNWLLEEAFDGLMGRPHRSKNDRVKFAIRDLETLISETGGDFNSPIRNPHLLFGAFWNGFPELEFTHETEYQENWDAMKKLIEAELNQLSDIGGDERVDEFMRGFETVFNLPYNKKLYGMRAFFEQGTILSGKTSQESCQKDTEGSELDYPWSDWYRHDTNTRLISSSHPVCGYWIAVSENFCCFINEISRETIWGTRDQFVLFSDLFSQRFNVMMASGMAQVIKDDTIPSPHVLSLMFKWGDDLLLEHGLSGFEVVSKWEALCTFYLLKTSNDDCVDTTSFWNGLTTEIKEAFPWGTSAIAGFLDVIKKLKSPSQLIQLYGLFRLWGHPTVDGTTAIWKLKSIATRNRSVDYEKIFYVNMKFREYFCRNYRRRSKTNMWPKISFKSNCKSYLRTIIESNSSLNLRDPRYKLSQWADVQFEKTYSIPERFELSEMISDKATSLNWNELKTVCATTQSIGKGKDRSVIIQYLKRDFTSPSSFLQMINDRGFDPQEKCIGVHPKERELKGFARLFALLTFEKRIYVVLTEALIADNILPCFPEITMTYDATTLQRRIYQNTRGQGIRTKKNRSTTVVCNMDFQKWNTYMRKAETSLMFEDMDRLHGLDNCIKRTHDMFEQSIMYLADGSFTPEFDDQGRMVSHPNCWGNHLGGLEGLRQKGWTIFTVILLKIVADRNQVMCEIMGQGDNQVLVLRYNTVDPRQVKRRHKAFLLDLDSFLKGIGPPLKLDETWSSSKFFTYGKFPVLEGLPLPMTLKKLSRTTRLINDGLVTLESTLSAISANASAACASSFTPTIPYVLARIESFSAVQLHLIHGFHGKGVFPIGPGETFAIPTQGFKRDVPIFHHLSKQKHRWKVPDKELMTHLMIQPVRMGGYPVLLPHSLLSKGCPDGLSADIYYMKQLIKSELISEELKRTAFRILNIPYNPDLNPAMLFEDPESANFESSSKGAELLKRMTYLFLTSGVEVQNTSFAKFLSIATQDYSAVPTTLYHMEPLRPRLGNEIVDATIHGRAMKLVKKLNNTNVLLGMMQKAHDNAVFADKLKSELIDFEVRRSNRKTLTELLDKYERNYFKSMIHCQCSDEDRGYFEKTASEIAQILRDQSWQRPIVGVTVIHPPEMLDICFASNCKRSNHSNTNLGYILMRINKKIGDSVYNMKVGPYRPYMGSATKSKVVYQGGRLVPVTPPSISRALKLMYLIGWGVEPDSKLAHVMKALLAGYTDIDPNILTADPNKSSGNPDHRIMDERTSHKATPSLLYNCATHVSLSTNKFKPGKYLEGEDDNINFMYQAALSYLLFQVSHGMALGVIQKAIKRGYYAFHVHVKNESCIQPLDKTRSELVCDDEMYDSIIKLFEEQEKDELWYIPKENLLEINSVNVERITIVPDCPQGSEMSLLASDCAMSYMETFKPPDNNNDVNMLAESSYIVAVKVAKVCHPTKIMKRLLFFRFYHYVWFRLNSWENRIHQIPTRALSEFSATLSTTDSDWFSPLLSTMSFPNLLISVIKDHPKIPPPSGTPPSPEANCRFIKNVFVSLFEIHRSDMFSLLEDEYLIPDHNNFCFNPISIKVIQDLLSDRRSIQERLILFRGFKQIREEVKRMGVSEASSIDVLKLESCSIQFKWIYRLQESRYRLCACKDSTLADRLPTLGYEDIRLEMDDVIPEILDDLSFFKSKLSKKEDLRPVISHLLTPCQIALNQKTYYSYKNRPHFSGSAAAYRGMTILGFLQSRGVDCQNETGSIFCIAEGAGNILTTIGRRFLNNDLHYNSLFEVEKLSSIGVDLFIPSGLLQFPWMMERVKNIDEIDELPSDLFFEETWRCLFEGVSGPNFLLTCDIESSVLVEKQQVILLNEIIISKSFHNSIEYISLKIYGEDVDVLMVVLSIAHAFYKGCYLVRSYSTPSSNSEIILFGCHPKECPTEYSYHISKEGLISFSGDVAFGGDTTVLRDDINQTGFMLNQRNKFSPYLFNIITTDAQRTSYLQDLKSKIGEVKEIRFPVDIVKKLRSSYNISVLTKNKSVCQFRPSILTSDNARIMTGEYLIWKGAITNSYEFEETCTNGYVIFMNDLTGNWIMEIISCHPFRLPRYRLADKKSYCFISIKKLFSKPLLKELFTKMGLLKWGLSQLDVSVKDLTYNSGSWKFPNPEGDWWKHTNKSTVGLNWLPMLTTTPKMFQIKIKQPIEGQYKIYAGLLVQQTSTKYMEQKLNKDGIKSIFYSAIWKPEDVKPIDPEEKDPEETEDSNVNWDREELDNYQDERNDVINSSDPFHYDSSLTWAEIMENEEF